ncbi:MAG: hypothetical protein HY606_04340, partial [Planctomycetes bacterium]|nr:hypothetical protein [Planctomycetota bacterium]
SYLHQGNKPAYYKIFYLYDIDRSDQVEKTYGAFAKRFSMNESDVRNRLSYTRRLFKKLLKEEIMNYSATSDIADAELRELLSL